MTVTKKQDNVLLSDNISPIRYKVFLAPDLDAFTFEGEEEIEIDVKRAGKAITLHSAEIEILSVELVQNKKSITGEVKYNNTNETATLSFPSGFSPGGAVLKLKFAGILNDKLRGFYRSRYELEGKTFHMGVTQFESTDARRAIPCFDEPSQKAIFDVTLKVPSDRTVISNTIESEILEHEGGFKTVKFEPSPKMSSYLLAFIVGHFEHIEKITKSNVKVRVFVTPGKKHQAEFALDVAARCIEFYEEYFGIKYPLPVMDLIAIPDFASGAMENWGAVTYRETAILVDPEHSATFNKQWVALVIAHELAHQWFGNLVTMEWWTHLWLNEGFASYMEYVAIDKLFPEWKIWTQFVYIESSKGLALDGLANTHPIEVDVYHPGEIAEIFDAVSYSKGAAVIRMLASYIGENDFRKGLQNYLIRYSYSNATTNDLWDALESASGKPVGKIMKNWTRKPGYPFIKVEYSKDSLLVTQSRFYISSKAKKTDKTLWLVPVSIISSNSKTAEFILLKEKSKRVPLLPHEWVEINADETSFIRVSYDPKLLELLEGPIRRKEISPEDRFGIIRDTFALSESSEPLSTDVALKIAESYTDEDRFIIWAELASQILRLSNLIYGQKYYPQFERYVHLLFHDIVDKVGWEKKKNEDYDTTLIRSTVVYMMGKFGDRVAINKARELFSKNLNIDADLRGVVYRLVAENGTEKEYEKFLSMYKKTGLAEEKNRILYALCSFKQKGLIKKTMDFGFSEEARSQDLIKVFAFTFANVNGRDIAWEYLQKKWKELSEKFSGGHLFSRFVSPLDQFGSAEMALKVENFFKNNPAPGIERSVAQVIEQIYSNAAWLERDGKRIEKFLTSR